MKVYQANKKARQKVLQAARDAKEERQRQEAKLTQFENQSGVEGVSLVRSTLDEASQNVAFSDQITNQMYVVDSEVDATRKL